MSVTLHTNFGNLKLELFCDQVPKAAENFLALAASGYYTGTKFHRNMAGFIVQGGDPTGTGKGGECIWGGTFKDQFCNDLRHSKRGIVSMANNGPDTNGSQFFICYDPQPHLNSNNVVIGQLLDGMDVLDHIEKVPVGKKHRPLTDIVIENVTIHANPIAPHLQ